MTTTLPKLAELSDSQRRATCAKALGWKQKYMGRHERWQPPGTTEPVDCTAVSPDPDHDANHALALVATLTDPWEHIRFVQAVCESEKLDWEMCVDAISMPLTSIWALITLKPRTLTSGFLLAKGLAR